MKNSQKFNFHLPTTLIVVLFAFLSNVSTSNAQCSGTVSYTNCEGLTFDINKSNITPNTWIWTGGYNTNTMSYVNSSCDIINCTSVYCIDLDKDHPGSIPYPYLFTEVSGHVAAGITELEAERIQWIICNGQSMGYNSHDIKSAIYCVRGAPVECNSLATAAINAVPTVQGGISSQMKFYNPNSPHTNFQTFVKAACLTPPACLISSVSAIPGTCNSSTNTYNLSGSISFSNAPTTGTLTVSDGSVTQTLYPPFSSPLSYSLTGLTADGATHTVTASFSAASCSKSTTYTAPVSCSISPSCSISSITANPGACNPSTNTYSVSGSIYVTNPPTSGTLEISDGSTTQTLYPPFNSPIAYSLSNIVADGSTHVVSASFSAVNCSNFNSYTAPESCAVNPSCVISSITANPGACNPSTNTYTVSGSITFTNPPSTGTLTVKDGSTTNTYYPPFISPLSYSISGLTADGATHYVEASFSAENCLSNRFYAAPNSCNTASCTSSLNYTVGPCNSSNNQYSITGSLIFSNPPSTGTLEITADAITQTYYPPFTSPQSFTLNGLNADGSSTHLLSASFSADPSCFAAETFTAPQSCSTPNCTSSLNYTVGNCNPSTNKYSITGTLTFSNPPSTGTLEITADAVTQTFYPPFTSPQSFTLNGLTADGSSSHLLSASFSADPTCFAAESYTAPQSCSVTCSVSVTASASSCSNNSYSVSGQITFSSPPTSGTLTVSSEGVTQTFFAPFTSPLAYTLNGLTADGTSHVVSVEFSANSTCSNFTSFTAPAPCLCSISAISTNVSSCNNLDNTYSVSGQITFSNPPSTGTLTISSGTESQVFYAPFSSPLSYSLSGLISDGLSHTISASFSANTLCTYSGSYTAPSACSCTVSNVTATPSACNSSTNTYSLSGQVTFTNAPTSGTLTVYVGTVSQTFYAPFSSPISYTLSGLTAYGGSNTVYAEFSDNPFCYGSKVYTAPASCLCSVTNITATPTACNTSTNTYNVSGQVTFSNAPTTGTLTVSVGGISEVYYPPFSSPHAYTLIGLNANGGTQSLIASFSANSSCLNSTSYAAPNSCSVTNNCSISLTASPTSCNSSTNTYNLNGQLTFSNAPTSGTLAVTVDGMTQSFNAPFTSPQAYTITGLSADGANHLVTVSFSADPTCSNSTTYAAPASCLCSIYNITRSITCSGVDNTYSISGQIQFTNAPSSGSLTISDGTVTQTFNAPFSSPISYSLSNINADGANHTLTATFSSNSTCTYSVNYTAPSNCFTPTCSVSLTANPSACNSSTNTYSLSGQLTFSNAPTSGTLTVSVGGVTQTFNAPFTSPQSYTLSGLSADGASHTVTTLFSSNSSCTNSVNYIAPASCNLVVCSVSVTATPTGCNSSDNTYSVSGQLTFSNAPTSGTLTVSVGTVTQTFNAPFTSPQSYTLSGLNADGVSHIVTATFSANSSCTNSANYTAPASCLPCSMSVTANPSACNSSTNTYSVSGQLTFSNAPTTGTLTVSVGAVTQTFNAPFSSPRSYTLNGLNADGASHTVTATFSANSTCTNSANYTAPTSCPLVCSVSLTANPSGCNSSTNTYSVSGQLTFSNAPTTGTLTVSVGNVTQTFNAPFSSPRSYTLSGLNADGGSHTVTATFSANSTCTNSANYTAPSSCLPCEVSLTAIPSECNSSTDTYSVSGQVTFSNPPTTGTLIVSLGTITQTFNAPFTSPQSYTLSGLNSDGAIHNILASFSASSTCNNFVGYTAPVSCLPCEINVTATPSACNSTSNTYSVSGQLTFSNFPTSGSLIVSVDGGGSQIFNAPFSSPLNYNLIELTADGLNHTVVATFTNNTNCTNTAIYDAPVNCNSTVCNISITAIPSPCDISTNTYSVSGLLYFNNPPSTGSLSISVDGKTVSLNAPFVSPLNYTVTGLTSDGLSKTITATFDAETTCSNSTNFTAPNSCTINCPTYNYDICPGETYTLTAQSGLNNYQWYSVSGTDTTAISGATAMTYIVTATGIYFWKANDGNGCEIKLCCPSIFEVGNCNTCNIFPPKINILNNVCPSRVGSINIEQNCGTGTKIQFSLNNGLTWQDYKPLYSTTPLNIIAKCVDVTDTTCKSINVMYSTNPQKCSPSSNNDCKLSTTINIESCNNNNTDNISNDDFYTLFITVNASNGGTKNKFEVVNGADNNTGIGGNVLNSSGTLYGQNLLVGQNKIFKADGTSSYNLIVRDIDNNSCFKTIELAPVASCSKSQNNNPINNACYPVPCVPIGVIKN